METVSRPAPRSDVRWEAGLEIEAPAAVQVSETSQDRVPVPEATPEALRFYRSGMVLWGLREVLALLIPALILFSGLSGRMWRWAEGAVGRWFWAGAFFTVAYFTLDWLLSLPLDFYLGYVRLHDYGLSNQSLGQWFGDSVKQLGFFFILVAFAVPGIYAFIRATPKRWWLYGSLVSVVVLCFIILISPVWVAPRFDDFGPMRDRDLEAEILALAERSGIEAGRVFEVNKSEDTERVNAYVAGLGATRRIVLWDTLVDKLERRQVLFVMGHEMGHYALRHVWYVVAFNALLIGLSFYAAHLTMHGVVARFRVRFGFDQMSDLASLPLLLLIAGVIGLFLTPVQMAFGRYREHEADRFALELTRDNWAGATSFVELTRTNLGNPDPGLIFRLFRAGHPVPVDRINFSNDYRPWETGAALKYSHLFTEVP